MTTSRPRRGAAAGRIADAALLLVLVLTAPLVILLIGMPIVLCLRAAIEILGRL
jgi:hypothetical protein